MTNPLTLKLAKTMRHWVLGLRRAAHTSIWNVMEFPADRPVFVIGCSRAGTTVVYKTLSHSNELGTLNRETHDFWADLHPLSSRNWDTHGLGPEDATTEIRTLVTRYFYGHTGKSRWVDKNNQNGLCVAYLDRLFPDAKFVYIKRCPGDNLNSLIEGWGKPDEFATWSMNLPVDIDIEPGHRRWCFFLAPGWRDYTHASIEEVCAFQYEAINRAIIATRPSVPNDRWIEVRYEHLVQDPVSTFRDVFRACDLSFGEREEAHCRGVLSRPYNAFSAIEVDKWKSSPNRARIERVLPRLRQISAEMGY
ncbi:MAG TPA: sulfotransferase [Gammaproteobacteria bacterium]|nr:sulfotransferase [Gammaproteobacteria bacterium]